MKKLFFVVLAIALTAVSADAAGAKKWIPYLPGFASEKLVSTYTTSQVDTVVITRDPACSGYSFALYTADSSSITNAIVKRVVDGKVTAVISGDTLLSTDVTIAAGARVKTLPVAPLPDAYWIIVTYAGSAQGVNPTTTPVVIYQAIKQYSK